MNKQFHRLAGKWKIQEERTEDYKNYLLAIGVDPVVARIRSSPQPSIIEIAIDNTDWPTWTLISLTDFENTNTTFRPYDKDGIKGETTMRLEEDDQWFSLVHAQVGERPYTIVRRVGEDSDTMDVTMVALAQKVTCTMVYKKDS